jgi:hypothetical protein
MRPRPWEPGGIHRPEDAGIPSRVIDELMGHSGGRRDRASAGSPMGRIYRETTPAMLTRVVEAIDERLGAALELTRTGRDAAPNDQRPLSRAPNARALI